VLVGLVCTTAIGGDLAAVYPREVFVAASASIDPSSTTVALADSDVYGMTQADVDKTMDAIRATNVNSVRLLIPWAGVEARQGQLDWSMVDKTVNSAASRNLAVVGVVNSTPLWAASTGGQYLSGRPASPEAYGDFVAKVASRYQGKIGAIEIWNEPNGVMFYTPLPDPAGYVDLLKASYAKIKAVDPSIVVLGGSLGAILDVVGISISPPKFLTQMYSAGAKGYFDALAFHPYQYTLKFSDGMQVDNSPLQQLMAMRNTMVANGDGDKKIWSTEYGEPVSQTGEAQQNTFVSDVLTKWQELPYTGPMYIYTTRDRSTGSFNPEDTFGVVRTDWTDKPARQTVRAGASGAIPKSVEFQRFSTVTDPALGTPLSTVYKATAQNWAQIRTVGTVYETASGFITSPTPVAEKAGLYGTVPVTQFANGYQDFDKYDGLRVWYSPATGAHSARVSIHSAWTPALGLAITDETGGGLGSSCQFEHGTISWSPLGGARVTFNNGQDPGQPPGGPVPTQPPGLGLPDVTEPIGALLALLNNVLGGLGSSEHSSVAR
jgi:polysaccharide biosynthesis protein PslG